MDPEQPGASADGSIVDTVRVPPLEAVAIEFPGYIRNIDRAMAALGGETEVASAVEARSAVLKLWLRPDDPLCHPLFGERRRARSLLLRVARPRTSTNGAGGSASCSSGDGGDGDPVSVTVAAVVKTAYRFSGLADFQYLPVDYKASTRSFSRLPDKNRPESAEVYKRPQAFLLVPPLFSKTDVPLDFAIQDDARDGEESGAPAAAESAMAMRVISFYNPDVPQPLPLQLPPPQPPPAPDGAARGAAAGTTAAERQQVAETSEEGQDAAAAAQAAAAPAEVAEERKRTLYSALQSRLAERPVWPPEVLLPVLGGAKEGDEDLDVVLAALCYQFKTGPWKLQLIRCGYDPRADREARRYQSVSYRCSNEW